MPNIRSAADRLNEAETSCANDQHRAHHNANAPNAFQSQIYAPGSEFALCQAMAQLMGAVIGVLNESLTESIRGFYRLRKAYVTLESILNMEEKFVQKLERTLESEDGRPTDGAALRKQRDASTYTVTATRMATTGSITERFADGGVEISRTLSSLAISETQASSEAPAQTAADTPTNNSAINLDPDSEIFSNQIDAFVHSGSNFCFGIILLIISMVPPAFSRLLSVIGFRGDKQRGLRMLWQASKFPNLIGAISALALLGYYNGFVRYCDIMPDRSAGADGDIEGYPQERLAALLVTMRTRYPNSQLWLLEESRMCGANKNLEAALDLLCRGARSPLKQVEALRVFERSLNAMYLHKYELCSESFIECAGINSWSRSLYYYIAGACHVVLYRTNAKSDPSVAKKHAEKATEYFRTAPTLAGRKRFMARQLPFDMFVTRKIAKWEARAKEWKVSLVDSIGVDPIEEMIFFWNGHSRMTRSQLEESLSKIAWSEENANRNLTRQAPEEQVILDLLRAAVLRAMRRHQEAEKILITRVLNQDKAMFKVNLRDDWVLPVAHFEMAANLWMERPAYVAAHGPAESSLTSAADEAISSVPDKDRELQKVRECKEHLDKAAKWESYELDTRVGLKVTAAVEAVQKWETAHSIVL
ncbi:Mitochondrial outer membrane protein iml2, variant 3 [Monascus purpureus]|nr:Mitochondrial outer membrane protein iml2, variant 3 [Monascus purpureus]